VAERRPRRVRRVLRVIDAAVAVLWAVPFGLAVGGVRFVGQTSIYQVAFFYFVVRVGLWLLASLFSDERFDEEDIDPWGSTERGGPAP
jgi:hypothetical protein